MSSFGKALRAIRTRIQRDLAKSELPKEKVLATIVRLLEKTLIRVGNEEYTKANNSFGLTTLRNHHVDVTSKRIFFYFRGKSGKKHAISVEDRHLARIVRRLRDLPGYELFQYVDDQGQVRSVGSSDVNDYLREITGEDFSSKDFRTWAGTLLAFETLLHCATLRSSGRQAKKNILHTIESVAERLGNTAAVCRKCYIHPAVFDAYSSGRLASIASRNKRALSQAQRERALVRFLEKPSREQPKILKLEEALKKSVRMRNEN